MKRHRILRMQFDTRATILATEIQSTWEPSVRAQWEENIAKIEQALVIEYGIDRHHVKGRDFLAAGDLPLSIVAFHNKFLRQARDSFVMGAYYPALTASCALGERILNHLILLLRDDFASTPEYKRVYSKKSFDNWDIPIDTLEAWEVLVPEAANAFRELRDLRNRSLHFQPDTDANDRELALDALQKLKRVVSAQFPAFGPASWLIPNAIGIPLIRRSWEQNPFVAKVVLPCCVLVGPAHELQSGPGGFAVSDPSVYPDKNISDDEFVAMYVEHRSRGEEIIARDEALPNTKLH
jgi:hypothetical protein